MSFSVESALTGENEWASHHGRPENSTLSSTVR